MSRLLRQFASLFVLLIFLVALTASPALAAGAQSGPQFCFGNSLTVSSGQTVDTILGFGCNITIEQGATVTGDILDFGGNTLVAGTLDGGITSFGGTVMIQETGVVSGNITSLGGNVRAASGAIVRGGVNQNNGRTPTPTPPIIPLNPFARTFNFGFDILGGMVTALAFAALGALVVIFAPNATKRVSDAAQAKPLNTAGVGCLTLILLPILGILLLITIVGIPVAFLLALAAGAAWVFGGIGIGLLTGEKILQAFKARNVLPVLAVILGILILMIVGQIPIVGWLVSCVVGLLGMGAVVLTRFGTRAYPTPPGMMMVPVAAAAAGVPNTYSPSAVDTAAWEAKARAAQARDVSPTAGAASELSPAAPAEPTAAPEEPGHETSPGDSDPDKPTA